MRAISCTCTCGSPEWKSNIILLHNLTSLPYLKHCNARLLLRAGLIRAAKMHEYLMSLCSTCTCMSPALDGSFALQHFEHSITVEMCNGSVQFLPGTATHVYLYTTVDYMQVHVHLHPVQWMTLRNIYMWACFIREVWFFDCSCTSIVFKMIFHIHIISEVH